MDMTTPVTMLYRLCPEEEGKSEEGEKKEETGNEEDSKKGENEANGKKDKEGKDEKAKQWEFTMGFYIPPNFQESPPKPSAENVSIMENPGTRIVSRSSQFACLNICISKQQIKV